MDLEVVETGNGGDLVKNAKDLSVILGFENMPYLAMFGGNVAASTTNDRIASEQDFSWWGNSLLMPNNPATQFNSLTEKTLNTTALTSAGRLIIEQAVKKDLEFMKPFAEIKVVVKIVATDKVMIGIQLTQPDNLQQKEFIYIWDATKLELFEREFVISGGGGSTPDVRRYFDDYFDGFFG